MPRCLIPQPQRPKSPRQSGLTHQQPRRHAIAGAGQAAPIAAPIVDFRTIGLRDPGFLVAANLPIHAPMIAPMLHLPYYRGPPTAVACVPRPRPRRLFARSCSFGFIRCAGLFGAAGLGAFLGVTGAGFGLALGAGAAGLAGACMTISWLLLLEALSHQLFSVRRPPLQQHRNSGHVH